MAEKDIPLHDCSVSPPSGITLAVAFGAVLMLGCRGQHPVLCNFAERPPAPFIDSQVVQATHSADPAEEPVFRSSRRIVPLLLVEGGPVKPESTVVSTQTGLAGDQRLFTASQVPKLVESPFVPLNVRFPQRRYW